MEQTTSATNNITFKDILARFRNESVTEHDKGVKFEKLIKRWFLTDPEYANVLDKVWLWEEFPGKESMGGVGTIYSYQKVKLKLLQHFLTI